MQSHRYAQTAATGPMMRMIFSLALLLFFYCSNGHAIEIQLPQGWVEIEPFADEEQQACRKNADLSWIAAINENELIIRERQHSKAKIPAVLATHIEKQKLNRTAPTPDPLNARYASALVTLPTGWLVAFDLGEWGGALWWFDLQGEGTQLYYENVRQLLHFEDTIYAATGLAHLGSDRGALLIFSIGDDGIPKIADTIQAPASLRAISITKYGIIGATFNGPVIFSKNGIVQYDGSSDRHDQHVNYPNTISADEAGVVYIAGRYSVARYDSLPDDFSATWLVPKYCTRFVVEDISYGRCSCINEP